MVLKGDGLPGLVGSAVDSCTVGSFGVATTGPVVEELPPGGMAHWFLVTAVNVSGEGDAGSSSSGPRVVDSSGACAPAGGLVPELTALLLLQAFSFGTCYAVILA